MKPILLATDGSPSAEAATAEALGLAHSLDVPLVVACVAHETAPMYGGYYGFPEIAADMRRTQLEHVKDVLAAVEQRALDEGISCTTLALEGLRGQMICEAARDRDARLVVIGAHGWDRIGRLIHGSVSTYVLHHAPCPVLVVHEDEPAERSEVLETRQAEIVA